MRHRLATLPKHLEQVVSELLLLLQKLFDHSAGNGSVCGRGGLRRCGYRRRGRFGGKCLRRQRAESRYYAMASSEPNSYINWRTVTGSPNLRWNNCAACVNNRESRPSSRRFREGSTSDRSYPESSCSSERARGISIRSLRGTSG